MIINSGIKNAIPVIIIMLHTAGHTSAAINVNTNSIIANVLIAYRFKSKKNPPTPLHYFQTLKITE